MNGRNLVDMLRDIELPFAKAEGDPSSAGRYDGLPAVLAYHPSRYYLGDPPSGSLLQGYPPGKLPVLGCNCGEVDCWPFLARITSSERTVTWSEFENFYMKPWTYEGLGSFVFERAQYESALRSYAPVKPEKTAFWKRPRRHP